MKVQVDHVWSTPSGLHMQVTVWANDNSWRHKHSAFVLYEDLLEEGMESMLAHYGMVPKGEDPAQLSLF